MYKYSFDPKKCEICGGKCCTGESGYIWISEDEIINLAKFLKVDTARFKSKFLYRVGLRFSIKEMPYKDGYACIFFNKITKKCKIYDFRPNQCKTFPFWSYFKTHFKELEEECLGVSPL